LDVSEVPKEAPLPTKIALFRATQELLSNATRHGQGKDMAVSLTGDQKQISLSVADGGPGLDPERVGAEGHLGLAGIREQAELLGGGFEVGSSEQGGAKVTVRWPL
jgi:signal transduction histidine kinase